MIYAVGTVFGTARLSVVALMGLVCSRFLNEFGSHTQARRSLLKRPVRWQEVLVLNSVSEGGVDRFWG